MTERIRGESRYLLRHATNWEIGEWRRFVLYIGWYSCYYSTLEWDICKPRGENSRHYIAYQYPYSHSLPWGLAVRQKCSDYGAIYDAVSAESWILFCREILWSHQCDRSQTGFNWADQNNQNNQNNRKGVKQWVFSMLSRLHSLPIASKFIPMQKSLWMPIQKGCEKGIKVAFYDSPIRCIDTASFVACDLLSENGSQFKPMSDESRAKTPWKRALPAFCCKHFKAWKVCSLSIHAIIFLLHPAYQHIPALWAMGDDALGMYQQPNRIWVARHSTPAYRQLLPAEVSKKPVSLNWWRTSCYVLPMQSTVQIKDSVDYTQLDDGRGTRIRDFAGRRIPAFDFIHWLYRKADMHTCRTGMRRCWSWRT